jgi:hypothetical protein
MSYDVPTTIIKNKKPLTLQAWFSTIPNHQGKYLFCNTTKANDDSIKLQLSASNFHIALKWADNANSHIAQVYSREDYTTIFTSGPTHHLQDSDPWDPPPPPTIHLPTTTNTKGMGQIPTSISRPSSTPQQAHWKQIQLKDNDDITMATVATTTSYSQNETRMHS